MDTSTRRSAGCSARSHRSAARRPPSRSCSARVGWGRRGQELVDDASRCKVKIGNDGHARNRRRRAGQREITDVGSRPRDEFSTTTCSVLLVAGTCAATRGSKHGWVVVLIPTKRVVRVRIQPVRPVDDADIGAGVCRRTEAGSAGEHVEGIAPEGHLVGRRARGACSRSRNQAGRGTYRSRSRSGRSCQMSQRTGIHGRRSRLRALGSQSTPSIVSNQRP